jgi:hypothetical protein
MPYTVGFRRWAAFKTGSSPWRGCVELRQSVVYPASALCLWAAAANTNHNKGPLCKKFLHKGPALVVKQCGGGKRPKHLRQRLGAGRGYGRAAAKSSRALPSPLAEPLRGPPRSARVFLVFLIDRARGGTIEKRSTARGKGPKDFPFLPL